MRHATLRWWWVGLAAFSLVILGAGLWLERTVSRQLETGLANELATIRDLNVAALREWLGAVKHAAEATAADEDTRATALALFEDAKQARSVEELAALRQQASLHKRIDATLRLWKLDDYVLIADQRVVSASSRALLGLPVPDADLPEAARNGQTAIDLPHRPNVEAFDSSLALMWVISPIKDDGGVVRGAIAFRLDTEKTFTRLLGTARFGDSGETYAFNREGLFISSSRFEEDLRRSGVLSGSERSVLTLSAREPGAELTVGKTVRVPGPLTRAARAATARVTATDVAGYRDYRGVEVVGAWTWLDDYGFGVTTEIDRNEAFSSTRVIRQASRGLTFVVFACALVIGGGSTVARRVARRVRRAERLGQYTLEKKIGEGGMGVVYEARHALLRRPTAIKVLKGVDADEAVQARFEREVQTMASLAHPNTVAVYDYGRTASGVVYYAMELLEGRSLEELVAKEGAVTPARAVHILFQVLGSLAEAHDRGLVHRDVKPANVMLCRRGGLADFVKVVDFGLVKAFNNQGGTALTQTNTILGTPDYMAPESIQDPEHVDHRADLYAVGGVAYYLLAGRQVFDAPNLMAILSKQMTEAPRPLVELVPGIAPELDALILRLLAKSADDRPANASVVIDELEAIREAHGLRWSQKEAHAWWDAHPLPSSAGETGKGLSSSAKALEIGLEGRTGGEPSA